MLTTTITRTNGSEEIEPASPEALALRARFPSPAMLRVRSPHVPLFVETTRTKRWLRCIAEATGHNVLVSQHERCAILTGHRPFT